MSPVGMVHTARAVVALGTGAGVLILTKGTRLHTKLGWIYAAALVGVNATALAIIYRLQGRFGVFHVLALVSLATLASGLVPAVRRKPARTWIVRHYDGMTWSYVGLLAAAAAEAAVRVFRIGFREVVAIAAVAVTLIHRGSAHSGSSARPPSVIARQLLEFGRRGLTLSVASAVSV